MLGFFRSVFKKLRNTLNEEKYREGYNNLINQFRRVTPIESSDIDSIHSILKDLVDDKEVLNRKLRILKTALKNKEVAQAKKSTERIRLHKTNRLSLNGQEKNVSSNYETKAEAKPSEYLREKIEKKQIRPHRDVTYICGDVIVYGDVDTSEEAAYFTKENVEYLNSLPIPPKICDFDSPNNQCKDCIEKRIRTNIKKEFEIEKRRMEDKPNKKRKTYTNVITNLNVRCGIPMIFGRYVADEKFDPEELSTEEREAFYIWREDQKQKVSMARKKLNLVNPYRRDRPSVVQIGNETTGQMIVPNELSDGVFVNESKPAGFTSPVGVFQIEQSETKLPSQPFVLQNETKTDNINTFSEIKSSPKPIAVFANELKVKESTQSEIKADAPSIGVIQDELKNKEDKQLEIKANNPSFGVFQNELKVESSKNDLSESSIFGSGLAAKAESKDKTHPVSNFGFKDLSKDSQPVHLNESGVQENSPASNQPLLKKQELPSFAQSYKIFDKKDTDQTGCSSFVFKNEHLSANSDLKTENDPKYQTPLFSQSNSLLKNPFGGKSNVDNDNSSEIKNPNIFNSDPSNPLANSIVPTNFSIDEFKHSLNTNNPFERNKSPGLFDDSSIFDPQSAQWGSKTLSNNNSNLQIPLPATNTFKFESGPNFFSKPSDSADNQPQFTTSGFAPNNSADIKTIDLGMTDTVFNNQQASTNTNSLFNSTLDKTPSNISANMFGMPSFNQQFQMGPDNKQAQSGFTANTFNSNPMGNISSNYLGSNSMFNSTQSNNTIQDGNIFQSGAFKLPTNASNNNIAQPGLLQPSNGVTNNLLFQPNPELKTFQPNNTGELNPSQLSTSSEPKTTQFTTTPIPGYPIPSMNEMMERLKSGNVFQNSNQNGETGNDDTEPEGFRRRATRRRF